MLVVVLATATAAVVGIALAAAAGLPVQHPVVQVLAWSLVMGLRVDAVQRLLGGPDLRGRTLLRLVLACTGLAVALVAGGMVVLVPLACALVASVNAQWDENPSPARAVVVTTGITGLGTAVAASGLVPQHVPGAAGHLLTAVTLVLSLGLAGNLALLARQRAQAAGALELERRERETELLHAADHDQLTGALGRRGLSRHVPLVDGERVAAGTAGLVLDLDGFKPVNDRHGHAVGDAVLVVVVQRLRAALPQEALLARTGGDEFLAVVPDVPDVAAVDAIASRLEECLDAPIAVAGHEVVIGVSIGTVWAAGPEPAEAFFVQADASMYAVKHVRRTAVPHVGVR